MPDPLLTSSNRPSLLVSRTLNFQSNNSFDSPAFRRVLSDLSGPWPWLRLVSITYKRSLWVSPQILDSAARLTPGARLIRSNWGWPFFVKSER